MGVPRNHSFQSVSFRENVRGVTPIFHGKIPWEKLEIFSPSCSLQGGSPQFCERWFINRIEPYRLQIYHDISSINHSLPSSKPTTVARIRGITRYCSSLSIPSVKSIPSIFGVILLQSCSVPMFGARSCGDGSKPYPPGEHQNSW